MLLGRPVEKSTGRAHHAHGCPFFTQRPVARVPRIEVPIAHLFDISGSFMFLREGDTALKFRWCRRGVREIRNALHHRIQLEPQSHGCSRQRPGDFMGCRVVDIHEPQSGEESVPKLYIYVEREGVDWVRDPSWGYNRLCVIDIYIWVRASRWG